MCARGRRLFFLSALFLSLSSWVYSQDGDTPLPVPDLSELSALSSLDESFPSIPEQPTPQIKPGMTLEQRQAATLKAWIEWSKEVEASWKKAKDSSKKLDETRQKQIDSRDIEIAALREAIGKTQLAAILSGLGGALTGYITGRVTR